MPATPAVVHSVPLLPLPPAVSVTQSVSLPVVPSAVSTVATPPSVVTRVGRVSRPPPSFYLASCDVSADLTFDSQHWDEVSLDDFFSCCDDSSFLVPLLPSASLLPIPSMKGKEEPLV